MRDRGDLRATADQMLEILDELRAMEIKKRSAPIGSPEFIELARSALNHGRLAFRWTDLQLRLAEEAAARVARGEEPKGVRIEDVASRPMDQILAQWREAQIRLEIAEPGSPAATAAASEIERLREEYQTSHAELARR
jgi:hypothetical protein